MVSRFEPLNRSSRREEAPTPFAEHCMSLPTNGCCQVHTGGRRDWPSWSGRGGRQYCEPDAQVGVHAISVPGQPAAFALAAVQGSNPFRSGKDHPKFVTALQIGTMRLERGIHSAETQIFRSACGVLDRE